jgi:hypothetical protein
VKRVNTIVSRFPIGKNPLQEGRFTRRLRAIGGSRQLTGVARGYQQE